MAKRKNEAAWVESAHRWQINIQCNGKRKTFASSMPGRKGKIAAERKADDWLERGAVDDSAKVAVLLDMYLDNIKSRNGESSASYRQTEKFCRLYIKPTIGAKRMAVLTVGDCQRVIDTAYSKHKLSAKTLQGVRGALSGFLKWTRINGKSALLAEGLTIPAGARKSERTILPPDALKILFSVDTTISRGRRVEEPYIWAYRFAVVTGLRPGEILGLQNADIDGDRYHIRRAINDKGETTPGKNQNAQRSGTLGELARYIISQQRRKQTQRGQISPWVFDDDGDNISQSRYYAHWKRYCASNGITQGTRPYELRHTFCSINDEMPESLKKMVMGHSRSMDTEGVYGHRKRGDEEKAAAYIDAAFAPFAKSGT